jgi:predicted transglutaminase-like cysteine proteinase
MINILLTALLFITLQAKVIEPEYGFFKMCKQEIMEDTNSMFCKTSNVCNNLKPFLGFNKKTAVTGNVEYIEFYNKYCTTIKKYKNKKYINVPETLKKDSKKDTLFSCMAYAKKTFKYMDESKLYPKLHKKIIDIWKLKHTSKNVILGDCDEFQLYMIYLLVKCDIPLESIYMTVIHAPTGEGHAVPLVEIKGQYWQFDNMLDSPIPAYWGFNGVGYHTSSHANGIFNMKEQVWKEFNTSKVFNAIH